MSDHHHHHHCCSSGGDAQDERVFQEQLDSAGKSLTQAFQVSFSILKLIMVALVLLFLGSGIFQVQPGEQALKLWFGEISGPAEDPILQPGFHIAFPEPIHEIVRIPVQEVQTYEIDSFWYYETPQEKLNPNNKRVVTGPLDPIIDGYCLTGNESLAGMEGTDYNIVHSKWAVTYKIGDPRNFFENVYMRDRKPGEDFLEAAAESVEPLLESLASNSIVTTMLHYNIDQAIRSESGIAEKVKELLQDKLQKIESGITIENVLVDQIAWPRQVDAAFQASTKARQESEQVRVDAWAYKEAMLTDTGGPGAEDILDRLKQPDLSQEQQEKEVAGLSGQVRSKISEARAYKTTVVSDAKANAEYLQQLLPEYKKHPKLVLQKIYQDAIEEVLANADEKILIQPASGKDREIRVLLNRDPNAKKKQQADDKTK
jgi:membrane protease subunit HflK